MKKQLLLLVMMLLPMVASAITAEIDGIYYNLVSKTKQAEVIDNPYKYSGSVVIPESVTYESVNYSVTSIGNYTFIHCAGLTSITIPNSVTRIGEGAFYNCSGLTSITIPNNVTSIENSAFYGCSGLTSITIPNNVTSIGNSAFHECSGLTSITIPNSVMSIGNSAFHSCSNLASITIPNSVMSIGDGAFEGCFGLTSVTIPNSVTSIGNYVFCICHGLTSVTIPNSVTSIGESAFSGCHGLTSITIPNSVTSIGGWAFAYCSGLTSFIIPNGVTSIGSYAFYDCSGLTSVTIGNSVTSIGGYAFYGCSGLTTAIIGNGIQIISSNAFGACPELTDVTCYKESVPNTNTETFNNSYIEYSTLHVPSASIDDYATTEPWRGFGSIVPLGDYYELSITSGAHGVVAYDNQSVIDNTIVFNVNEGSNLELTITPETGYQVSTLTVNGEDVKSQLTNGVLTISNVTANMTVEVTFELIPGYTENIKMTVPNGDRTAIGYSSSLGLDFTGIEDVKAWIVTGFTDDANVLLSRVRIVPPYTGLYLTSNVAPLRIKTSTMLTC